MIMADILKIFLLIVGLLTVYVSYWLVAQALFPGVVERARQHYARPVKITLIGIAAALLPVIIGAAISNPWQAATGALAGAIVGGAIGTAADASRAQTTQTVVVQDRRALAAQEQNAANYRRAIAACLYARGYSVR